MAPNTFIFLKKYNAHHPMTVFIIAVVVFVTKSPFTPSTVAKRESRQHHLRQWKFDTLGMYHLILGFRMNYRSFFHLNFPAIQCCFEIIPLFILLSLEYQTSTINAFYIEALVMLRNCYFQLKDNSLLQRMWYGGSAGV